MLLCEQCKSMSKPLFLLLLLLSWRVYEVVGMQLQSREISVETATNTMFTAVPTTTTHERLFSETAVIKPTMSFSMPSPSTTPARCKPCKDVDFTTPAVIFLTTTILLLISAIILTFILLLTCNRMKKVQKQCKSSANAVFPDNSGVSHWISSDDVPTLSENISSQNDQKRHNIWSLSTRPVTFRSSSENANSETQSPDHAVSNSNNHSSRPSNRKIKPKRKAPGPPVKAKKKHAKEPVVPAGYIYPQAVCKEPQTENAKSTHVYDVPHTTGWRNRLKKSTPKRKQEYQEINISQMNPPGPYAELNHTIKSNGTSTHAH